MKLKNVNPIVFIFVVSIFLEAMDAFSIYAIPLPWIGIALMIGLYIINYFFGFDMEFTPELSILLEYNAALNENDMTAKTMSFSKGGYLNAAIRWTFVERLHIEMDFNNLLFDDEKVDYFKRELKITYIEYF